MLIHVSFDRAPKLGPDTKYRKNMDFFGDLWPFQHLPTNLKLTPFVNLSLIYTCTKFHFGDSFPSWWGSAHNFTIEIHSIWSIKSLLTPSSLKYTLCISMVNWCTLPHYEGEESPKQNLVQMYIRLELTNGVSFKLVGKCWKGQRSPRKSVFFRYFVSGSNFGALSEV